MKDDDDFTELFDALPEDLRDELIKAVEESDATSPEDFISPAERFSSTSGNRVPA
jgi:hypothetical protein